MEQWAKAQNDFNEAMLKAMEATGQSTIALDQFNATVIRREVETYGLEEALSRYLGLAGNEVDDEFLAQIAYWEKIVGAKVTLLPRWKFYVEKID